MKRLSVPWRFKKATFESRYFIYVLKCSGIKNFVIFKIYYVSNYTMFFIPNIVVLFKSPLLCMSFLIHFSKNQFYIWLILSFINFIKQINFISFLLLPLGLLFFFSFLNWNALYLHIHNVIFSHYWWCYLC